MVKWEGCDWKFIALHVQQTDTAESIRPYLEAMRVTALDVEFRASDRHVINPLENSDRLPAATSV